MPASKIGRHPVGAGRPKTDTAARLRVPGASHALPAIYRAALDEPAWADALRDLAGELHSPFAVLVTIDKKQDRAISLRTSAHADPDTARQIQAVDRYPAEHDLVYQATRGKAPGEIFFSNDVVPIGQLRASPLRDVMLKPFGVLFAAAAIVENDQRFYTCFGFWYGSRKVAESPAIRRRLSDLVPHLAAAVRVNRRLRQAQGAHWASLYSMQFSRHGVLMLDHHRHVTFANREAERILRLRDGIALDAGRLVFADEGAQAAFDRFAGAPGAWLPADLERKFRVPRPSRRLPFEVLATSRLSRPDYWRLQQGTAFIVVMSDPVEVFAIPKSAMVRHYGLTPCEADLCRALIRAGNLARAAADCGISTNTARSHLKKVFAKLHVTSQVQLMQWLGSSIRAPAGSSLAEAMVHD